MKKMFAIIMLSVVLLAFYSSVAMATSQGMPWESPLEKIQRSLSGPVTKVVCLISIVMCGIGIMMGAGNDFMRKILMVVLGASICVGAASLISGLFGSVNSVLIM